MPKANNLPIYFYFIICILNLFFAFNSQRLYLWIIQEFNLGPDVQDLFIFEILERYFFISIIISILLLIYGIYFFHKNRIYLDKIGKIFLLAGIGTISFMAIFPILMMALMMIFGWS